MVNRSARTTISAPIATSLSRVRQSRPQCLPGPAPTVTVRRQDDGGYAIVDRRSTGRACLSDHGTGLPPVRGRTGRGRARPGDRPRPGARPTVATSLMETGAGGTTFRFTLPLAGPDPRLIRPLPVRWRLSRAVNSRMRLALTPRSRSPKRLLDRISPGCQRRQGGCAQRYRRESQNQSLVATTSRDNRPPEPT